MADTVIITGEKTVTVVTVGVQGPAGISGSSIPATNTTLGGIIVGDNLSITGNGVLSVANTFQPKLANTTYGLTDTGVPYAPSYSSYYVNGDYVTSGLKKSYIGLRGERVLSTGTYLDPDQYAMGSYLYNPNGTLQSATSVETDGSTLSFQSSNTQQFSFIAAQPGFAFINASNATSQTILNLGSGVISGNAQGGHFRLRGNLGGTGDNSQDYQLAFGPTSGFDRGICFQQAALKSTIGFQYAYTDSSISYKMTNGLVFDNTTGLGGFTGIPGSYTSFQHTTDAVISGVRTGTEIRASRNKAELFYLNISPVYTSDSILTQGYADTRYQAVGAYLTSANLTFANITGTPTTLAGYGITDGLTSANLTPYLTISSANATYAVLGHTHSIANVTGLQTALDAKLETANFTYANLTGKPSTFAPSAHTHAISEVTGLQTALDLKLPSANFTYANITGKPTLANVATSGSYADLSNTPNLTLYLTTANAASSYLPSANFTYANITGKPSLATVATSGSYTDLSNTPAAYSLPTATTSVLGGVKVDGTTVTITGGVISAATGSSYTLPTASTTVLGGVKVDGSSIVINSGIISSTYSYTLPAATVSTLGGVRLGTGVGLDANGFLTTDVKLGANSFTGTQNLQDNELIRAKLRDYSESVSSPTISSGTLTLNLETSNIFTVSLNAAITTITITNVPASGSGASFTLIFTADGTARAVTWPSSIKWAGGTAPTLTSTSGKVDSFAFFTSDGGTNWQGYVGGQNF